MTEKLASLSDDSQLWYGDCNCSPEQPRVIFRKFFQNDGIIDNVKAFEYWDYNCWTDFASVSAWTINETIINSEDSFNVSFKRTNLVGITGDLTQMELKNGVLYVTKYDDYNGKKDYEFFQITQQQLDEMKDFEDTYPECSF